jgi:anti-anti-sigma factor
VNNFSLLSKSAEDIAIMIPKGYINDIGAERLEQTSERLLGTGLRKIVVNFSGVQYINTIGISIFTGMVQRTIEHHSMLCFTNMKKVHRDMFELVGLTKHVRVFRDEKDALKYLHGRM